MTDEFVDQTSALQIYVPAPAGMRTIRMRNRRVPSAPNTCGSLGDSAAIGVIKSFVNSLVRIAEHEIPSLPDDTANSLRDLIRAELLVENVGLDVEFLITAKVHAVISERTGGNRLSLEGLGRPIRRH